MGRPASLERIKKGDLVFFRYRPNGKLETKHVFDVDSVNIFLRWPAPVATTGYLVVRFNKPDGFQNGGGFVTYHSIHPFDLKHVLEFVYDSIAKRVLRLIPKRIIVIRRP